MHFLDLPVEIHLQVLSRLQPAEIVRLSQTCRSLCETCRSDEVWRDRVESIVSLHLRKKSDAPAGWKAEDNVYARYVQPFLSRYARFLGWFATSSPYRGRLIRCSLVLNSDSSLEMVVRASRRMHDGHLISLQGEEVGCRNGLHLNYGLNVPGRWKPQAAIWHGQGDLSYLLPENHPSPDAGFSVDILNPILEYTHIFAATARSGVVLTSGIAGSLKPCIPISLSLNFAQLRRFADSANTSERYPHSYSEGSPCYPSRDAVRAGIVRSLDVWGDEILPFENSGSVLISGSYLIAPAFCIKSIRDEDTSSYHEEASSSDDGMILDEGHASTSNGFSMAYRRGGSVSPPAQLPILIDGQPQPNVIRNMINRLGSVLPFSIRESLLGPQIEDKDDDQEYIYGARGPLNYPISSPLRPTTEPYLATDLQGLWVGCYASHGYEFGYIVLRNVWTRVHTADEVALEQIYDEEGHAAEESTNADPSIAREPLAPNLEGSIRRRRSVLEYIKLTGDTNVPAGQVSWVAVLPSGDESEDARPTLWRYLDDVVAEPLLDKLVLPTVQRREWEEWSDLPPSLTRRNVGRDVPKWSKGSTQAAGRIAFNYFVDTRFIDAQATFVREESGAVDEIRIRWPELFKVSCFRRCSMG